VPRIGVANPLHVDNVITGTRDEARYTFRPEGGCNTGCQATPVVAGEYGAFNAERVQQVDEIAERLAGGFHKSRCTPRNSSHRRPSGVSAIDIAKTAPRHFLKLLVAENTKRFSDP
jgi:hypothetical protein